MPKRTTKRRIELAILHAMKVCRDPEWLAWAADWLSGKDRSLAKADAAIWDASRAKARAARSAAFACRAYAAAEGARRDGADNPARSSEYAANADHEACIFADAALKS